MKIVYEYINQLKQLDKYDDATIIITADHGAAGTVVKDNGEQIQQSLPIMFVKMPYTASDEIVISEAPVAQEDLISTILNVSGVDTEAKVITDYKEGDDRVRVSRVRTGSMDIKYEINGNVRDVESWSTIYSKQ
jgi:arylsulfatase A-like enzyme